MRDAGRKRAGQADEAKFAAIRTGAGEQLESAMAGLPVTTIAGAQSETIRLRVAAGEGARQSGGVVHVQADEGQSVTVVEQIVPTGDGATALQTKLYAKKNAKICLVQLLFEGEGHTLINDVGGLCEENASIELVQLIVGEHIAVDGARVDLVGDGSKFESAMGYLAAKDQKVDINLIVNHIGRKTNCVIEADGSDENKVYVLLKVRDFKFVKPVIPGDRLELHAELLRGGAGVYSFAVDIQCDGQTRAKGELMFTAVAQNSIYGETQ